MKSGLYRCPGMPATCMAAERAMRLAVPFHQGLERQRRIEPGAKGADRGFVAAVVLCVRRGGGLGGCGPDVSARNGFTLSKR